MTRQGSGRIIHMAARAAVDPFPGAGAYIVSKSGLLALIKVLALELAGSGVKVNGVLPATIDTPANRQQYAERRSQPMGEAGSDCCATCFSGL